MAAFVAFAVGCSAAPGSEVQIAEGSAEFSQSNLVVKLDANPTTGYEWTFQIDGSGEATLTFTYARSWEASDSDKSVVLHATVENGAFTQVEEQA